MTTLGIEVMKLGETKRSNQAQEAQKRAELEENMRSHMVNEGISLDTLAETHRSNVAREKETARSNLAKERETNRANKAKERENELSRLSKENIADLDRSTKEYIADRDRISREYIEAEKVNLADRQTLSKIAPTGYMDTYGSDDERKGYIFDKTFDVISSPLKNLSPKMAVGSK